MRLSELEPTKIRSITTPTLKLSELQSGLVKPLLQTPEKAPNYFQRVGQRFQEEAQGIIGAVESGADAITDLSRSPLDRTGSLLRTGLRTAGGIASSAFAPILEAPGIRQAVEFVAEKVTEIPGAEQVINKATELTQRFPEQAKDIQNIVDIVSLGYAPKVTSTLSKEGRALSSDLAQGTKIILTPSEEAVQKSVVGLFQKSIKPTPKKTLAQGARYENDVVNALKTIKANVDNLNIEDDAGELVAGRAPQTINELAQALDQTKGLVFKQYDDLARQANGAGATIDVGPVADELLIVANNRALQITNPELIKYAEQWSERLRGFGNLDTQTAQEVVKNLNNSLSSFYRNPTYESASKVAIDAGIVNQIRKSLDDAIEGATGKEYQALKNQYGALKAIENDVVRASNRVARRNTKGLLDYTDIFTSGQMIGGVLSLNPAMFTKGAVERGFKEYIKFLNDPNRAVGNMFNKLDITDVPPFSPQSATFQFINKVDETPNKQGGFVSLGGKDPSKAPTSPVAKSLAPDVTNPTSFKTADDYVKAQGTPFYHGTASNFEKFDSTKTGGAGFYFTRDKQVVEIL